MVKVSAKRNKRVKAVRAKAQAKIARNNETVEADKRVSTKADDKTQNHSKIDTLKSTDEAPMPTENNGNSHPVNGNNSHDSAHKIATLEEDMTDTVSPEDNSSDTQKPLENNGNSKLSKTFVEIVTNSSELQTREKIKTTSFHILRDILESTSKKQNERRRQNS